MNAHTVKRPQKRIDTEDITQLDIISFGRDNLYAETLSNIVASSESGSTCLNLYVKFIQGNGLRDKAFSEIEINDSGDTIDDLLAGNTADLAKFGGFAIHCNYNMLGQPTDFTYVPFETCRLSLPDDSFKINKIAIFPDWSGRLRKNNIPFRPTRENIDYIDRYNPDPEVVLRQIEDAGGIENYKGQVFWYSSKGRNEYPIATYDSVVAYMSIEEGLSNTLYNNARRAFRPGLIMAVKPSQEVPATESDDNNTELLQAKRDQAFFNEVKSIDDSIVEMQGDENSSNITYIAYEREEDLPRIISMQGENYDDKFKTTSATAEEKIYAAFNQEVFYRLRKGSVGFSSDIVKNAYDFYSSMTDVERRSIERAYSKLFKGWSKTSHITDYTIEPLEYVINETTAPNNSI